MHKFPKAFLRIVQPASGSAYAKVLAAKGEGLQVVVASPREKDQAKQQAIFSEKGFNALDSDGARIYFKQNFPFQIEVAS